MAASGNSGSSPSRSELVSAIAAEHDLPQTKVEGVIKSVEQAITKALAGGGEIRLSGLGSFRVTSRAARAGRNPATGAAIKIAASKGVGFRAAKVLKDAVGGKGGSKGGSKGGAKAGAAKGGAAKGGASKAGAKAGAAKGGAAKAGASKAGAAKGGAAKAGAAKAGAVKAGAAKGGAKGGSKGGRK